MLRNVLVAALLLPLAIVGCAKEPFAERTAASKAGVGKKGK
jgi:hypothetical protein